MTGESPAEIARLVDYVIDDQNMELSDKDTFEVIIWLCHDGHLQCDDEYFDWKRSVSWSITGAPDTGFVVVALIAAAMVPDPGGQGFITPTRVTKPPTLHNPCNSNSFSADTHVLMADGSTKPIEQVEVGDIVLATDPATGLTEPKQVIATIIGEGDKDLVRITVGLQGPAHRQVRGTRKGRRSLTPYRQAVFGLASFREKRDIPNLGRGFGLCPATSYNYINEIIDVLAAQAPDLHQALQRAKAEGLPHLILDGKIIDTDRLHLKTISRKGEQIDLGTPARSTTSAATSNPSSTRKASRCGSPTSFPETSTKAALVLVHF